MHECDAVDYSSPSRRAKRDFVEKWQGSKSGRRARDADARSGADTINDKAWARYSTVLALWARRRLRSVMRPGIGSIVTLPFNFCVKATPFTRLAEAHVMEFVRQNSSVPVPKVYAAFVHKGRALIVMQRVAKTEDPRPAQIHSGRTTRHPAAIGLCWRGEYQRWTNL